MKRESSLIITAVACLLFQNLSCSTAGKGDETNAAIDARADRFEIEVELITGDSAAYEHATAGVGSGAHVITAAEATQILHAAAATGHVVQRPRMVVSSGARATISTMSRTEYVQDFDADARALMGTVEHGVLIEATPKSYAGDRADVAFSIEVSVLREPMRSAELTLEGSGKIVTVQLPEVEKHRVNTSFVLGGDQAAIVPLGPTAGDDPVRAAVLRVRRIL